MGERLQVYIGYTSALYIPIDNSQYRLLFGFFLLYTDRVPFELLDSAALLGRESCGGGGQIVFLNLTTII
jgi:hypothetical protein